MTTKLIVALDFASEQEVLSFISMIKPGTCVLKVGSELFTLLGPAFIRHLVDLGYLVFLDLKFHDIPNTVANACRVAARLGVWMINVHASGGLAMMKAAKTAIDSASLGAKRPLLIAVTVLTSMDAYELPTIGVSLPMDLHVNELTTLAYQAGLDGVVCSAFEVSDIKAQYGAAFLTITPGIRLPDDALNDQVRVVTPKQAQELGSDYVVIGRPITQAAAPLERIKLILQSLGESTVG